MDTSAVTWNRTNVTLLVIGYLTKSEGNLIFADSSVLNYPNDYFVTCTEKYWLAFILIWSSLQDRCVMTKENIFWHRPLRWLVYDSFPSNTWWLFFKKYDFDWLTMQLLSGIPWRWEVQLRKQHSIGKGVPQSIVRLMNFWKQHNHILWARSKGSTVWKHSHDDKNFSLKGLRLHISVSVSRTFGKKSKKRVRYPLWVIKSFGKCFVKLLNG